MEICQERSRVAGSQKKRRYSGLKNNGVGYEGKKRGLTKRKMRQVNRPRVRDHQSCGSSTSGSYGDGIQNREKNQLPKRIRGAEKMPVTRNGRYKIRDSQKTKKEGGREEIEQKRGADCAGERLAARMAITSREK